MAVSGAGVPDSVLGRLLQEVSWEGRRIRAYRDGGRGFENVLAAEALAGLDFLPRQVFLGAVLSAAHGADEARAKVGLEVEDLKVSLLPDEVVLAPSRVARGERLIVQPDGFMSSPNCLVLVEAKRIRRGSFQPEQLAREYAAVIREAADRTPLLLLILGNPPPVRVTGQGRMSITDAISRHLGSVLTRMDDPPHDETTLITGLDDTITWITWHEIATVVDAQRTRWGPADPSLVGTINRLADSVIHAVTRHT
ncbi:MAG: hypothetical protein QG597_4395 [Actinomycetota bacterium]|nr:hypothetical protein [Actinomycetota bacterium]